MKNEKKIIISNRILTKKELYEEKKQFRKKAKLSFEEKIKVLVDLQKLAYSWGRKKDIIVWKL